MATGHSQPSVASSNNSKAVEVVVGKELAELQAATAKQKMIANSSATEHSNAVNGWRLPWRHTHGVDVPLRKTAEIPIVKWRTWYIALLQICFLPSTEIEKKDWHCIHWTSWRVK